MTAIQLLACAGMIAGVFLMLGIRPVEFTDSLFGFFLNPRRSLREELKASSGRKKEGILRREMKEAQAVLQMTGRGSRFSMVCAAALALFCMGRIDCDPDWKFFPGSGNGSRVFVSAILVCEADGKPL